MSVLEQRQNSKRTFCHNYMDKEVPPKLHYGCDQEIYWVNKKKFNMDHTPHQCTHSNELRSKANEAANNAAALKEVAETVEQLAQKTPPAVFKKVSDFSPQDEFVISIGRLNTNVEKLLELHMQTNELLKQVIKVKGAK